MLRRKKIATDQDQDEGIINLTPLIDVVFVVLICFILVAPLLESENVDLAGGGGKEKNLLTNTPVNVYIRKDDTLWLNRRMVSPKELASLLKEEHRKYPTVIPKIFPDKEASFGKYQQVKNIVEDAGFPQMDIILKAR